MIRADDVNSAFTKAWCTDNGGRELEGIVSGVKNYCVDVKKKGDDIVFLRKMKRGGADGSYGISVAALAGIPKVVTLRAKEILSQLEEQDAKGNNGTF